MVFPAKLFPRWYGRETALTAGKWNIRQRAWNRNADRREQPYSYASNSKHYRPASAGRDHSEAFWEERTGLTADGIARHEYGPAGSAGLDRAVDLRREGCSPMNLATERS